MTPRRPNTPTLTREQIVSAAMSIVDREGIDALSMRGLASELGVGTMSLYYHVPDKSALYDLILDAVMSEADLSGDDPSLPYEERVVRTAYALRAALLAHPNAAVITMSRSLRTPAQLRPVEAMLGVLYEAGLSATDAMQTVNVIGQFVFGTSMAYASHLSDGQFHDFAAENDHDFSALAPEEFPNLGRAIDEAEPAGWDADFEAGLRVLVRGLVLERGKPKV